MGERLTREELCEAVKILGFDPYLTKHLDISNDRVVAHLMVKDEEGNFVLNKEQNEVLIETMTRVVVG